MENCYKNNNFIYGKLSLCKNKQLSYISQTSLIIALLDISSLLNSSACIHCRFMLFFSRSFSRHTCASRQESVACYTLIDAVDTDRSKSERHALNKNKLLVLGIYGRDSWANVSMIKRRCSENRLDKWSAKRLIVFSSLTLFRLDIWLKWEKNCRLLSLSITSEIDSFIYNKLVFFPQSRVIDVVKPYYIE